MVEMWKLINLKVFNINYIKGIVDDCIKQRFIIGCPPRMCTKHSIPIWEREDLDLILKYRKDLIK